MRHNFVTCNAVSFERTCNTSEALIDNYVQLRAHG